MIRAQLPAATQFIHESRIDFRVFGAVDTGVQDFVAAAQASMVGAKLLAPTLLVFVRRVDFGVVWAVDTGV
jgi:hypothetical protein